MDSTIGASYVSLDANDTTKLEFCYDGNIRVLPYHENKKLAIDDFTFRPLPFRLVSPPFFNHAKNIIRYSKIRDASVNKIPAITCLRSKVDIGRKDMRGSFHAICKSPD